MGNDHAGYIRVIKFLMNFVEMVRKFVLCPTCHVSHSPMSDTQCTIHNSYCVLCLKEMLEWFKVVEREREIVGNVGNSESTIRPIIINIYYSLQLSFLCYIN